MKRYLIRCPICGERLEDYMSYWDHILKDHPRDLWARFRAEIIKA